MPAPLTVLVTVLILLFLLATLPVSGPLLMALIAVLGARDRRRLRAVAARTSCLRCGHLLGRAALDAADAGWAAVMAGIRQRHPHAFHPVVRFLYARCTNCGMDYGWTVQSLSFHPLPVNDG